MAKQENIRVDGVVISPLPNAHFIVKVISEGFEGHQVNAHISGKMRLNYIKIMPGDHVVLELTPFDLSKGRIVYRGKEKREAIAPTPSDSPVEAAGEQIDPSSSENAEPVPTTVENSAEKEM